MAESETPKYPYAMHDDGIVLTQPESGKFVETPMTLAQLAARDPAWTIAKDIYRHANQAGVCYYEIWRLISVAIERELHLKDQKIAELERDRDAYMIASKMRPKPYADTDAGLVAQVKALQSQLAAAQEALRTIADGMTAEFPGAPDVMKMSPDEFRGCMWTWSQKCARAAIDAAQGDPS